MPSPLTTFVLPCFNEGARIAASLATLDGWFGPDAEILVVDDGSTDDTFERASVFAGRHPNARVERFAHRGKGGAIRSAIPLIRTDRVVFLDADISFDRDSVVRAIEALETADMAIGNRRHDASHYWVPIRLFGFLYRRHLVGLAFNAFVRAVTGVRFRDTQCGLKAYRRTFLEAAAPALTLEGFALDVEILLVATALGAQVAEVPVEVRYETARSSVKLAVSGRAMGSDILRIGLGRVRGRYALARLRARAEAPEPPG
jgi:glycosyltransferase involved in cell wall biosynthesis